MKNEAMKIPKHLKDAKIKKVEMKSVLGGPTRR